MHAMKIHLSTVGAETSRHGVGAFVRVPFEASFFTMIVGDRPTAWRDRRLIVGTGRGIWIEATIGLTTRGWFHLTTFTVRESRLLRGITLTPWSTGCNASRRCRR